MQCPLLVGWVFGSDRQFPDQVTLQGDVSTQTRGCSMQSQAGSFPQQVLREVLILLQSGCLFCPPTTAHG